MLGQKEKIENIKQIIIYSHISSPSRSTGNKPILRVAWRPVVDYWSNGLPGYTLHGGERDSGIS